MLRTLSTTMKKTTITLKNYPSQWWIDPGNEGALFKRITPSEILISPAPVTRPIRLFESPHPYWFLQEHNLPAKQNVQRPNKIDDSKGHTNSPPRKKTKTTKRSSQSSKPLPLVIKPSTPTFHAVGQEVAKTATAQHEIIPAPQFVLQQRIIDTVTSYPGRIIGIKLMDGEYHARIVWDGFTVRDDDYYSFSRLQDLATCSDTKRTRSPTKTYHP